MWGDSTVYVENKGADQLCGCTVPFSVFAYAKSRFYHDAAQNDLE